MTRTRTTVSALAIVLGALLLAAMFSSPRAHAQEPQPTTTVIVDCYGIQGYDAAGAPIWGFIPCDDVEEPCQVIAGYDANGKPVYRDVPCDDLPDCNQITHYDPNCHNDDPNCIQLPGIAYVPGVCCEELLGQISYEEWLRLCNPPTCDDFNSYPSPEAWVKDCFDCKDLENLPTPSLLDYIDLSKCEEPTCDDFNSFPSPQAWIDACYECGDKVFLPDGFQDLINEICNPPQNDCDDIQSFDSYDEWMKACTDPDCSDPASFPSVDAYLKACPDQPCDELKQDCGEPTCDELQDDCGDHQPTCEDTGDCLVVETPTPTVPVATPVPPDAGTGTAVIGGVSGSALLLAVMMVAGGGLLGGAALGFGRNRQ